MTCFVGIFRLVLDAVTNLKIFLNYVFIIINVKREIGLRLATKCD